MGTILSLTGTYQDKLGLVVSTTWQTMAIADNLNLNSQTAEPALGLIVSARCTSTGRVKICKLATKSPRSWSTSSIRVLT
jgi:hypothetical protein